MKAIQLSPRAVDDVHIIWPDFDPACLATHSAEEAHTIAEELARVVERLKARLYGRAAGPTQSDANVQMMAAGALDLLNEACGFESCTLWPASPGGHWHRIVGLIAEASGRHAAVGGEDFRYAIEAVRDAVRGIDGPARVPRRAKVAG